MNNRHALITADELADLAQIDRLLDEANAHAYSIGDFGKSSEGYIEVSFGNHFDRDPDEPRFKPQVSIYSYMLGPYRQHHFDSIAQALAVVKVWHHNEMLRTAEGDEDEHDFLPDPYLEIERARRSEFAADMNRMEELYG